MSVVLGLLETSVKTFCFELSFIANEFLAWRVLDSNCLSLNAGDGVKTNLTVACFILHVS